MMFFFNFFFFCDHVIVFETFGRINFQVLKKVIFFMPNWYYRFDPLVRLVRIRNQVFDIF